MKFSDKYLIGLSISERALAYQRKHKIPSYSEAQRRMLALPENAHLAWAYKDSLLPPSMRSRHWGN